MRVCTIKTFPLPGRRFIGRRSHRATRKVRTRREEEVPQLSQDAGRIRQVAFAQAHGQPRRVERRQHARSDVAAHGRPRDGRHELPVDLAALHADGAKYRRK